MSSKRGFKRLLSGVIAGAMAVSMLPSMSAFAEKTVDRYPYTLFAGSDEDGAITVNADNLCVNGNVATNGTIISSGNMNINGTKKEHASEEMIYVQRKLNSAYFSGDYVTYYAEDYTNEDMNININSPIDVQGSIALNGNANLNSAVRAMSDISISGEVMNTNNAVIYSQAGDITLSSNNVGLSGLVYAPCGDVEITAQNLNLNNVVIIANKITLTAPSINANYSNSAAEIVGTESELVIDLFAYGTYNSEASSIDVEWYTNYTDSDYEIWTSDDNVEYASVAVVSDTTTYQYPTADDFEIRYFKVSLKDKNGDVVESTPFVVKKINNSYIVTMNHNNDNLEGTEVVTPYVLYSLGNTGSVTLNSKSLSILGNMSSVTKININSEQVDQLGENTENDNGLTFDSLSTLNNDIDYTTTHSQSIHTDNCVVDTEYYYQAYSCYSDSILWSGKMFAHDNINLNANELISGDNIDQVIESETGSINIDCDIFDYKGLIYAPEGAVTINSSEVIFSGMIIADKVTINGLKISIKENDDIFSYYNSIEQSYQRENEKIIDEYINVLEELKNDPNNIEKKNYDSLRKELIERSLLLNDEEKAPIFEISTTNATTKMAKSRFKPCDGIEKMYDVIRRSSTYPYNGKTYRYYSLTVTDKYTASNPKFTRHYSPNLFLLGKCTNGQAANKILNKTFQSVFGTGLGSLLKASGHPVAGFSVKKVFSSISPFGTPSAHDLYTTSKNFFRLTDVSVNTTMKYYWVNYNGKWEFAYSCDKTKWKYTLSYGKLNCKTRLYDISNKSYSFTNKGNFYKPYVAIKTIVDYKKLFGSKATTGNYDPYGYSMTQTYCIKNSDGKSLKTFKPQFVKNTIGLM